MKNSRIVLFGGSGFLGHALIQRLISQGETNILSVSRNESLAVALKEKFPSVQIMIGDIRYQSVGKKAMNFADQIFLMAALKHVGIAEKDVQSCINTNVIGCMNVINESLETNPDKFVFISSDKAAQGTGVYGISKKLGEKMMIEAQEMNCYTKYRTVRYGNVLYSSGSVLCKWRDKMKKGEEIIVTDIDSTRFFWSVDQAIDLIFECIEKAKDATPYITAMKSIRLGDLLNAMMEKYGKVPVKTIGLQPGENMHEIITPELPDSFHSERYTKEEILNLI